MTTMSSNIAGVIKPFARLKRPMYGYLLKVDELSVGKKKKEKVGVYEVVSENGRVSLNEANEKKYVVNGKKGVWRTIKGRHYFFPDDGSATIPPMYGGKNE